MKGYLLVGNWGCLLLLLIFFNLFFGRLIFYSTGLWLGIEAVLVLILMLKIKVLAARINQQLRSAGYGSARRNQNLEPDNQVVDIQGQVVEEDQKLK